MAWRTSDVKLQMSPEKGSTTTWWPSWAAGYYRFYTKIPGLLKLFCTWMILGSSRVLIRPYTWASTKAVEVQPLIHRIGQKPTERVKRLRFLSMTRCSRMGWHMGREALETNGSNQCKISQIKSNQNFIWNFKQLFALLEFNKRFKQQIM